MLQDGPIVYHQGEEFRHAAGQNNIDELIRIFTQNPQIINQQEINTGKTALHLALENRQPQAAYWLAKNGANFHALDNNHTTPMMLALHVKATFITNLLTCHTSVLQNLLAQIDDSQQSKPQNKFTNIVRLTLRLPARFEIKKGDNWVKKIKLFVSQVFGGQKEGNTFWVSSIGGLLLKFKDKTKMGYHFEKENATKESMHTTIQQFYLSMIQAGACIENSHRYQYQRELILWGEAEGGDNDNLYAVDPLCVQFYNHIANYVAQKVWVKIKSTPNLCEKARENGIILFSFGCGAAKDLIATKKFLEQDQFHCQAIGFDINPGYVNSDHDTITTLYGDMNFLNELILPYDNDPNLKIGLFVGSLVHQCLKGTLGAVNILQQAKSLDVVLITGYTEILVTQWIVKAMGWKGKKQNMNCSMEEASHKLISKFQNGLTYDVREMLILQKMEKNERKAFLIKRGTKRNQKNQFHCLDLSMSFAPLDDLNLFNDQELTNITQIDLSWALMNEDEVKCFFEKITAWDRKLNIIISNTETWVKAFKSPSQFLKFFQRNDSAPYEVPALIPCEARELHLYNSMPTSSLKF